MSSRRRLVPRSRQASQPGTPTHTSDAAGQPPPGRHWSAWLPPALILGLAAVAFSASYENGLLNFDDPANITQNAAIRAITLQHVRTWFTTPLLGMYTPLVYLSYAIDYAIGGLDVAVYHTTNLLLHLINILLVWLVARRLAGNLETPTVVAALFAVHPVNAAAVVPLSVRSSLLYAVFYLAAYLAYLSYLRRRDWWRLGLAFGLFLLSALSKSAAVVFPLLLLLTDAWQGREWSRRAILEKVPFFAASIAVGLVGLAVRQDVTTMGGVLHYTLADRVFVAAFGLAFYAWTLVAPFGLSAFYAYPAKTGGHLPLALYATPVALAAAGWLLSRWRAGRRVVVFGALFFLLHLALVLKVVPLGLEFAADRYLYLPSIGLFFVAAELLRQAPPRARRVALAGAAAFVAAAALASYARCSDWKDSETFSTRILDRDPSNAVAHNDLAAALASRGRNDEAIAHYRKAVDLAPTYLLPRLNLAELLAAVGRRDESIAEFRSLLDADPANAKARAGLGLALAESGRPAEAVGHLLESVRLDPTEPKTRTNLGAALATLGRTDEAMAQYREALALAPSAEAHNNLGAELAKTKRLGEAAAEFEAAIGLDAGLADAHRNLALVLAAQGRDEEAIREFGEALRINDRLPDVHYNVAILLARHGRMADAARHLASVVEQVPADAGARRLLDELSAELAR